MVYGFFAVLKILNETITYEYNIRGEGDKLNLHKIYFYRDRNGNEPVAEYIAELARKKDKDSRIKLNKIRDYIIEYFL